MKSKSWTCHPIASNGLAIASMIYPLNQMIHLLQEKKSIARFCSIEQQQYYHLISNTLFLPRTTTNQPSNTNTTPIPRTSTVTKNTKIVFFIQTQTTKMEHQKIKSTIRQ